VDASVVGRGGDGAIVTTQQAFAATWTLRGRVTTPRAVVALKPNSAPARAVGAPTVPAVRMHDPVVPDPRVRVVERTPRPSSGRPDLGEAQVVVVGGRGTDGDFSAIEDLADALGGAVGATRVATDEGWIGHEAQIGQTGVTISPRLYIGAGVSGAVHHRGGMVASGTVVAVDTDPDAPIFEFADFGVVGDLFTVLPQAAAEVRRRKGT
jgi:electron transfer flavoprotein alpha subunit